MTIDWTQMQLVQDLDGVRLRAAQDAALEVLAAHVEQSARAWDLGVPLVERLGWGAKEAAARALVAGQADAGQKALIAAEADVAGQAPDDVAQAILRKSADYSAFVARVTAERRRFARLLEAAQTVAEVEAVMAEAALDKAPDAPLG